MKHGFWDEETNNKHNKNVYLHCMLEVDECYGIK